MFIGNWCFLFLLLLFVGALVEHFHYVFQVFDDHFLQADSFQFLGVILKIGGLFFDL